MRIVAVILLVMCFSCSKSNKEQTVKIIAPKDTLAPYQEIVTDSSKLVKVIYNKEEAYFDKIAYEGFKKWFNELNPNYFLSPDEARAIFDKNEMKEKLSIKDPIFMVSGFYILYGHFLKERNGNKADEAIRKKTIKTFKIINSIYRQISDAGGMYFRHQEMNIPGYAEYAVYTQNSSGQVFQKKYDIKKQRALYIQSLRQEVLDAASDPESIRYVHLGTLNDQERKKHIETALKLIDELDGEIDTYFDLRSVQQFHYSHY